MFFHTSPLVVYILVAVILLLESSAVPIANTTLLLFTGALASMGRLNIWLLCVAAILGSIAGACLAYAIGAQGGRNLFFRVAAFFRVQPEKVAVTERWFHQAGVWMVFCSRIIPYVRPFACFPAGITRMPFARFFAAALSGSIIWCAGILSVGWMLGGRWTLALTLVKNYTFPTIVAFVLLIVLYFFVTSMVRRLLQARLQATQERSGCSY
jgi:membrane protein DedA with SNARE-associated domain